MHAYIPIHLRMNSFPFLPSTPRLRTGLNVEPFGALPCGARAAVSQGRASRLSDLAPAPPDISRTWLANGVSVIVALLGTRSLRPTDRECADRRCRRSRCRISDGRAGAGPRRWWRMRCSAMFNLPKQPLAMIPPASGSVEGRGSTPRNGAELPRTEKAVRAAC